MCVCVCVCESVCESLSLSLMVLAWNSDTLVCLTVATNQAEIGTRVALIFDEQNF